MDSRLAVGQYRLNKYFLAAIFHERPPLGKGLQREVLMWGFVCNSGTVLPASFHPQRSALEFSKYIRRLPGGNVIQVQADQLFLNGRTGELYLTALNLKSLPLLERLFGSDLGPDWHGIVGHPHSHAGTVHSVEPDTEQGKQRVFE